MARLGYCYYCKSLAKLDDPKGNDPNIDPIFRDFIQRHLHGFHPDDTGPGFEHKGVRLFIPATGTNFDSVSDWEGDEYTQAVRQQLHEAQQEVFVMRDECREDAVVCFGKHNNPEWPGKPCIDYRTDPKMLGGQTPKAFRRYLCDFCPYEESVRVQKRWDAGQYR